MLLSVLNRFIFIGLLALLVLMDRGFAFVFEGRVSVYYFSGLRSGRAQEGSFSFAIGLYGYHQFLKVVDFRLSVEHFAMYDL